MSITEQRVRRATVVDAPELVRLRAVMLGAMGIDTVSTPWIDHAVAVVEARLTDVASFSAFVVDAPGEALASCAVAWIDHHLPGPNSPDGWSGMLANVATDPRWRRQGLATLCVTAADSWLAASRAPVAYLHATPDGEALYRSLGWGDPSQPNLLKTFQ